MGNEIGESTGYIPLWCKSNYSFLEGASHPEELVEEAARLGLDGLALTDRNGVYGMGRAHVRCRELEPEMDLDSPLHLIVGSQLTVCDTRRSSIVLLVQNKEGYRNLCKLVSRGHRAEKGSFTLGWEDVCELADGLIALWGGDESLLCASEEESLVAKRAQALKEAFGDRLYAMIARHRRDREVSLEARIRRRARRYDLPTVAANEVLYHKVERRELQDVLVCIQHGATLSSCSAHTKPNDQHFLRSPASFVQLFSDDPGSVARSRAVARRCEFSLSELRYRYPVEELPGLSSSEWLRKLTFEGARRRYGGEVDADVAAQIERELALIDELDYGGYFLTMHEIVRFCRKEGILCQGRGSAANSVVCFCLGITAIDPVRMNLLFERFISRERAEPPDIDLDISHERREEVIRHVYERFGRKRAAMVASVTRYRSRSAVREVGKTLDIPETTLDRLAKLVGYREDVSDADLHQVGLDPRAPSTRLFVRLIGQIHGFPRHLATHPGGFIIGREPLSHLVPIEKAAMEGRTIIQWDKYDVDALGLFKVDLLGLGALTLVDRSLKLVAEHRGRNLSMATIPAEDPRTFEMVCRADTVGVFQIESRAQMAMLPRLKPRRFYDLVIEISLVRPGPIAGDMVHPYLRRRRGLESVEYPHPCLEPVLEKTLGVPLFQEQVMKLAMVAADYSPGEADQLRRDMAAWRREGRMEKHRKRMVSRMLKKGISPEFADRVFNQIRGFGEYGFPESHAASFALICYATAWLKCHYPAEFTCALLNAQPMGFYSPATIVEEARRHEVAVRGVDVRHSEWDCTMEPHEKKGFAVRMGLRYVKGMGEGDYERIDRARRASPFYDLADFARRTRLDSKTFGALARSGALFVFESNRRTTLWKTGALSKSSSDPLPLSIPDAEPGFGPLTSSEEILWDHDTTHHSTAGHPLSVVRAELSRQGVPTAREIAAEEPDTRVDYAGLVICRQRPKTASGVVFLTLEDETGFVNVVLWTDVYEKYRLLVKTQPFLGVTGKVQVEDEVVHVIGERLWKPCCSPATSVSSRDFH